ncbi:EAL domain-containing protein [Vibrio sp. UCD-FRSSP16_10]|nr:EAL domain-containing protein [Vibrio sp. UCD-FRSSP16_30]OBT22913.1 EAL domain-containing protein [Vibrio sp. UCD-FRSSP16_10]
MVDLLLDESHRLLKGVDAYINFTHDSIIQGLPLCLPPEHLIIEVLEGDSPSPALISAIKDLHLRGYKIALDDFIPSELWEPVLPFISIIKFDIQLYSLEDSYAFMQSHSEFDIVYVAEKIEDYDQYQQALRFGFHRFQGYYLAKPELLKKQILNDSYPIHYYKLHKQIHHTQFPEADAITLPDTLVANEIEASPYHQFIAFSKVNRSQ